jgi:hypothetical protein
MELPDIDNIMKTYQSELLTDLKVDELSLKDKAMLVPALKHKWVARTMTWKSQIKRLNDAKKKAMREFADKHSVALSKSLMEQAALSDPRISQIHETVEQIELLIEYLEKIEKLTGTLTWDCKNLIDLQRLETT